MNLWTVFLTFGIAVFTITLSAIVNTKIRFASDEAEARRSLLRLASRALFLVSWISSLAVAYWLVRLVLSTEPLTRSTVAMIASGVGVLVYVACLSHIRGVLGVVHNILDRQHEMIDLQRRHLSLTERVAEQDRPQT